MTSASEQGRHCAEVGVHATAVALDEPGVADDALADAPWFRAAVEQHQAAGRRQVPYETTPAIERLAHDTSLQDFVHGYLGETHRWVMWGSNIQTGTPNAAGAWHVDLESFLWPSLTVAVGLEHCTTANATRYIPWSHLLDTTPSALNDREDEAEALATTRSLDPRCDRVVEPAGFGDTTFFGFNARGWHSGNPTASMRRTMLFLHFQRASEPRVPLMLDYERKQWSRTPAPYIVGPSVAGGRNDVEREVYRPPSRRRTRLKRRIGRIRR